MEITDLMIGNWVLYKDKPIKIIGIDGSQNIIYYYNEEDYTEYPIDVSNIEPIPLTKEILEKNGFKEHRYHGYFIGQSNSGYYIYFDDNWLSIHQSDYDINTIEFAWCKYVHVLQNALKLCGLKKEIVL